MKAARLSWFERQLDLDPDNLVFLDETATDTKMVRRYGGLREANVAGLRCRSDIGKPSRSPPVCAPAA